MLSLASSTFRSTSARTIIMLQFAFLLLLPPFTHAQLNLFNFNLKDFRIFNTKVGILCAEGQQQSCQAGGIFGGLQDRDRDEVFSGTYVCRTYRKWLLWEEEKSICVPTLLGAPMGQDGDLCGCCSGECPSRCECKCSNDDDHVWVYKGNVLGTNEKANMECVSRGKAERWTAREDMSYSCVPMGEECPTMAPTASPTSEFATIGTVMTDFVYDEDEEGTEHAEEDQELIGAEEESTAQAANPEDPIEAP